MSVSNRTHPATCNCNDCRYAEDLAKLAVSTGEAGAQEERHPEATCQRCGRDNIVWFAPNEVWNRVMPDDGGIMCPVCFVQEAERVGIVAVWRLAPEVLGAEPLAHGTAEWWKAVAQGLARKLWPAPEGTITPTRCRLCGGTFHLNHSPESAARALHDGCAAVWPESIVDASVQEDAPLTDAEREQFTWWMWMNPNTAKEAGTQRLFLHIAVIEQALTLARHRAEAAEQDTKRLDWLIGYPRADVAMRASDVMRRWEEAHPNGGIITPESLREAIDAAALRPSDPREGP